MKKRSPLQLPAATLAEVLVALALTSIIFVIGTIIWMNLNTQDAPSHIQRQRFTARALIQETEAGRNLSETTLQRAGVKYLKEVRPVNPARGLYEVSITCLDPDGRTTLTRSKIIRLYEER